MKKLNFAILLMTILLPVRGLTQTVYQAGTSQVLN